MTEPPSDFDDPRTLRLIHRASRIFIARGYEAASVEEIAAAAGIGKASVYRMVGDKADLLGAVMRHASRHLVSACRVVLDPERPAPDMLAEFAETYIAAMYRPFAGGLPYFHVARLMIATSFTRPDDMRGYIAAYAEAGVRPLAAYLAARVTAGELARGGEDEAVIFFQLVFYTDKAIAFAETAPPPGEIRTLAHARVRQFLYGCGAPR